jgi:hypothetical protein
MGTYLKLMHNILIERIDKDLSKTQEDSTVIFKKLKVMPENIEEMDQMNQYING